MDSQIPGWMPFQLCRPWQLSGFSHETPSQGLFEKPDLETRCGATSLHESDETVATTQLSLPSLNVTEISPAPQLEIDTESLQSIVSDAAGSTAEFVLDENDPWAFPETDITPLVTTFRSWESFQRPPRPLPQPWPYLSEAGKDAFDAVLQSVQPSDGVLRQEVTFKAFGDLAFGRSSVFFQWNTETRTFEQTLKDIAISGMSATCSQSLTQTFLEQGTAFRRLYDYAISVNSQGSDLPTLVALKRSIAIVLETLETMIASDIPQMRSLLHLQAANTAPKQVLETLSTLQNKVCAAESDEEVVSAVSSWYNTLAEAADSRTDVVRAVLEQTSAPWLEQVMEEIGIWRSGNTLFGFDSNVKSLDETARMRRSNVHTESGLLMSRDDRAMIHNIDSGLQTLMRHSPAHPLVIHSTQAAPPLHTLSVTGVEDVARRAREYETEIQRVIENFKTPKPPFRASKRGQPSKTTAATPWSAFVSDIPDGQPSLLELDGFLEMQPRFVESPAKHGLVQATLAFHHDSRGDTSHGGYDKGLLPNISVVETIRPFLEVQSRLVNDAVMRYMLHDCNLEAHLDLHRDFFLLGDREFVARLSTSLFSSTVQAAERKRGAISTSQALGLRLDGGAGERWPPATSELNLSLMGILDETYRGNRTESLGRELPGNLSFAVRELSDANIERVSNRNSVHALDFLRLQYVAPSPLDEIITPEISRRYDGIFQVLLVHLRMLHLANALRFATLKRGVQSPGQAHHENRRIGLVAKAHHLIITVASHATETAIQPPWRKLSASVKAVRASLSLQGVPDRGKGVVPASVHSLRKLHEECVEQVRGRLFMERRHEHIRKTLDEIFDAVLQCVLIFLGGSSDGRSGIIDCSTTLDGLHSRLLTELAESADTMEKAAVGEKEQQEADAARSLVIQLDWNGYYRNLNKT